MARCDSCPFYMSLSDTQGECRESPPRAFMVPVQSFKGTEIGFQAVFPHIVASGWCGAHPDFDDALDGAILVSDKDKH